MDETEQSETTAAGLMDANDASIDFSMSAKKKKKKKVIVDDVDDEKQGLLDCNTIFNCY